MDRLVCRAFISTYFEMEAFFLYFNEKKMRRDLKARQAAERETMLLAGMPECDIEDVFHLEMEQLRDDIRFYKWLGFYLDPDNETLSSRDTVGLDVMDEIENPALHAALKKLKPKERALMILHVVEGLPLRLISTFWGESYDTVKSIYRRAIKRLQNIF